MSKKKRDKKEAKKEAKLEFKDGKKGALAENASLIPSIGGDLEKAVLGGKAIVINNDAETDDGRAVAQILKALSYLITQNEIALPVNVAMVVGDGNPLIRLNIIKTLVECMRADGYLSDKIKITYIHGQNGSGEGHHPVYESIMQGQIEITEQGNAVSLTKFMEIYGQKGGLVYGLKEPQDLLACFAEKRDIFAGSDLYTYIGGHNYKPGHGSVEVVRLLDSFKSVKGFSNFIALQGEKASNPRDITQKNTPAFSELILNPVSKTTSFLKEITVAWNAEIIFKMCVRKLSEEATKITQKDQEKLEETTKEGAPAEVIEGIKKESGVHTQAIQSLQSKINSIKYTSGGHAGQIDLSKMDVTFIRSLASDLEKLPQDRPVNIWTNIAKEPELQSVIADDLAAFASFLPSFVDSYGKGHAQFQGEFLVVNSGREGNLQFATKVAHHDIREVDSIEAYILSNQFPPKMEEPVEELSLAGQQQDFLSPEDILGNSFL